MVKVRVKFYNKRLAEEFLDAKRDRLNWAIDSKCIENGVLIISGKDLEATQVLHEIASCVGGMEQIADIK